MQKKILTGAEARAQIYNGAEKVRNAVASTLGPMGRNVIISRCYPSQTGMQYYMPFVTKDGVTVARNIMLDDQLENTGANFIKQASEKTMADAGDGTSTTCVLMMAILKEGIDMLNNGSNPQQLKKDIDKSVSSIVGKLKAMAIPVGEDIEKIRQIATVSANNDTEIGDLIAETFKKIGMSGDIDIEEAKGVTTEIKIEDGITFNSGWLSPYFVTNHAKQECELVNPYILLYDKKLTVLKDVQALLEIIKNEDRSVLIVCDDADGEALAALAMNAAEKRLKCCIVKSPEFRDLKRESMEDLSVITGGLYVSDEKGRALKTVTVNDLGNASKVIIGKEKTVIVSGAGDKNKIDELISGLRAQINDNDPDNKEKIKRRIAKLTGSVAVLHVGAATEVEMNEKKDRVDDAIRATKAAIAEGVVPGGGTAFIRCIEPIQSAGFPINKILSAPFLQICNNAAVVGKDILPKIISEKGSMGYNAKKDVVEDLSLAGIIDPVKVLRCSLENATSAATMILTSETLICDTI